MNGKPILLTCPRTVNPNQEGLCHAILTDEGIAKLESTDVSPDDLIAGIDYEVGTGDGETWLAYPKNASTENFRNTWIIRRRDRPVVPCFGGCPVPCRGSCHETNRTAQIVMASFRA